MRTAWIQDAKVQELYDLSAERMRSEIRRALAYAADTAQSCCFYFSMHGMGSSTTHEALIGEDSEPLHELEFRELMRDPGAQSCPLAVFVVDSCHSGGMLNMSHTYAIQGDRLVEEQHCDSLLCEQDIFDPTFPCLYISAVRETETAILYPSKGSLFTLGFSESRKPSQDLHTLLTNVAYFIEDHKTTHEDLYPVVSFNPAFVARVGGVVNTPNDAISLLKRVQLTD
jgi:hypothetical protein